MKRYYICKLCGAKWLENDIDSENTDGDRTYYACIKCVEGIRREKGLGRLGDLKYKNDKN
jgi:hypothetical protein